MTERSATPPGAAGVAPARPRRRGPRWVGWLLRIALALVALAVAIAIALRQPAISTGLAKALFPRIHIVPRSTLSANEVRGDWFTNLELRGVRVMRGDTLLAAVDTLRARYRLASLLTGELNVREILVDGVVVTADIVDTTKTAPPKPKRPVSLADILRGRFYPGPPFHIDRFSIRNARYGGYAGAPDSGAVLTSIGIEARRIRLGRGFSFSLDSLHARGHSAQTAGKDIELWLTAGLDRGRFEARSLHFRSDSSAIDGDALLSLGRGDSLGEARLVVHARPWTLRDLAGLVPGLALDGAITADIDVRGTRADRMSGTIAANTDHVRWGAFELGATTLNATLVDGRSDTKLSTAFERASADVRGWLRPFDTTPTYDLDARIDRLPDRISGLAWWPSFAERAQSNVALRVQGSGFVRPVTNVTGHVSGNAGDLDLDARLDLTNGFAWTVRRLTFTDFDVARLIGDTTSSSVSGTLTGAGQEGRSPPRSRRLVAGLELGPSSYGEWQLTNASVRASAKDVNLGASLRLATNAGAFEVDSIVGRWDKSGAFRLRGGRFHDVDLERITRQAALASRLTGGLEGQVSGLTSLASPGGGITALRAGRVSGELRVGLLTSTFRGQQISRGSVRLTVARGGANVDGAIESPSGHIDLAAHTRPFDTPPTYDLDHARFTDLDLSAWTDVPALRSRMSGTLAGRGRAGADSTSSGTWEGMLHLDPSTIGNAKIEGADTRATWSEERGQVTANLRALGDTLSARGEIALRDRTPEGHVDLTVPFSVLAAAIGRDTLKTSGRLVARTSFVGLTPATATMDGVVHAIGSFGRVRLDSLFTGFHLRQGTLQLDTLVALSNMGRASGAGHVALFDSSSAASSEIRLNLLVDDASPLQSLLGLDTVAVDTAKLALRVHGRGDARQFEVSGAVRSFAWNDLRVLRAEGAATGDLGAGWQPSRAHIDASVRRVRGIGATVNEASGKVDFKDGTTTFDVTGAQDEQHHMHLAGHLRDDSLGHHLALERMDVQTDSTTWALTHPAHIDFRPDRLAIDGFELRSANGRIDAHGVIDRRGEQNFRLDVRDVQLDVLSAWLGRANLTGTLSTNLALDGPAAAPRGNGNLQLDVTSDGQPAGSVRSRAVWNGEHLDFDGQFTTPKDDSLTWVGSLPLAVSLAIADSAAGAAKFRVLEGDVDVRLKAQRFPLAAFSPFLDPRSVGQMDGTLDLDTRLRGSSRAVVGSGRFDVSGGVAPIPAIGVVYRNIELHGQFEDNRLVIQRTHLTSEKGSLDATGELRFIGVTRVEPRLHVNSQRFVFVQTPDLRAIASGSIDITGTLTSLVVKGKATIENSSYTLIPTAAATAATTEPGSTIRLTDADLRMLEENFGDVTSTQTPNAGLRLYDDSDLDLAISLTRNNWVRQRVQPKMSVALSGDFRLKKAPHGEPELFGRIAPIPGRGYVEQFARSFDIAGGEVLLNGPMKEHRVDIQAEYKPPSSSSSDETETIINLDVEGTIEDLKLTLSSEPPMSEVEIVSYIATGHSAADKSSSSSSSSESSLAKDIGLSQVTGFAEGAAQEAIGLDVLQVRFDALTGATLVAGRYLDPKLYVGFRQPLQYKDSGTPNSSVTNSTSVEMEYAIYQWLVLNLQGETSKVRSFIRARHAY